jgi:hypothetical protein
MINLIYNKKENIYILGSHFYRESNILKIQAMEHDLKDMMKIMRKFSYVEKFSYNNQIISDTDWGCTIRCGQMLFFNAILFKVFVPSKVNAEYLIHNFLENKMFGINSFLKIGEEHFNKRVKKMWEPKTFFMALKLIIDKNNNKIKFNEMSTEKKLDILIIDALFTKNEIRDKVSRHKNLLLVFNINIGMYKCEDKFRTFIFDACKMQQFTGIIGAESQMSYFIVGHNQSMFYYLDPHKIKTQEDQESMKSYTINGFYEISYSSLIPYMTLTFMVNMDNCEQFIHKFLEMNKRYELFVEGDIEENFDDTECAFDIVQLKNLSNEPIVDDSFPVLLSPDFNQVEEAFKIETPQKINTQLIVIEGDRIGEGEIDVFHSANSFPRGSEDTFFLDIAEEIDDNIKISRRGSFFDLTMVSPPLKSAQPQVRSDPPSNDYYLPNPKYKHFSKY